MVGRTGAVCLGSRSPSNNYYTSAAPPGQAATLGPWWYQQACDATTSRWARVEVRREETNAWPPLGSGVTSQGKWRVITSSSR